MTDKPKAGMKISKHYGKVCGNCAYFNKDCCKLTNESKLEGCWCKPSKWKQKKGWRPRALNDDYLDYKRENKEFDEAYFYWLKRAESFF